MKHARHIVGISCLHFEWKDLEDAFRRCRDDFGFDLLELSTNRLTPEQFPDVARLRQEYGITLGLHAWVNLPKLGVNEGTDRARALLEDCRVMGVRHLVVHLGTHPARREGLEILRRIVAAVASDYAEADVQMCLENHYPYEYGGKNELGGEPEEILAVIDGLPPAGMGFCLDYGHANMSKNTSAFLEQAGRRLSYVHLADNMGEHDDHLAYGEGTVAWEEVLKKTVDIGFTGPFVVEFPESRGRERIDACVAHIRRLVDERQGSK